MRLLWAALLLAAACAPAGAVEVEPVYDLHFLRGQYFFEGGHSSLAGNLSGLAAPAVRFNERWELYPSLASSYKGTKEVVDVVGAGTVFQEQMEHRLGVKGVYKVPDTPWRVKPSVSYAAQFLKETKDESFGKGLFDYRKLDMGVEGEYVYKEPFSVRAGFSYFMTHYPNYTSLESQAALDFQGQPLARELVGDNVLDAHGQMLNLAGELPWRGLLLESGYTFMHQRFGEQRVVNEAGLLDDASRNDYLHALNAGVRYPVKFGPRLKGAASFDMAFALSHSNQNNYDAQRTRFIAGHYDYRELRFSPGARLSVGDQDWPTTFSLNASVALRSYPNRPIQDSAGTYQGDSFSQTNYMLSFTAARPVAPRFKALFNVQYGIARSNQEFEQFYSYNYSATNYLFGLSYEY